jgi:CheY-like chemotaxis protein
LLQRDQTLPADSKEKLTIISRSGQHLLALIEDVLEMSKIEAGRVSVQPVCFNLLGMLGDLTAMFRLRAEAKGLGFQVIEEPGLPRQIVTDEGKFRQVLVNLLGNAVKYTQQGRIELQIEVHRNEDRQLWLSTKVTDTGMGIAAEEIKKLFYQFENTAGDRKFTEGTGLGLAISREYARLMQGEITATSQMGQGSCFHFRLPIREGDHNDSVLPVKTRRVIGLRPGQPQVVVLLADDNVPNRNWLKQLLMLIGCQVLEAANGEEAIRLWEKWKPRLILMDLQMPVLDGFEATRRIKALAPDGDTIIIALTATVLEESRRAILLAGAADLLGKPMEESLLFDKMQAHLGMNFLYESEGTEEDVAVEVIPPERQREWVVRLPLALRNTLRNAIANGDLEGFEIQLKEVARHNPALARLLRPLAEEYDYDQLLRLLS